MEETELEIQQDLLRALMLITEGHELGDALWKVWMPFSAAKDWNEMIRVYNKYKHLHRDE